MQALFEGLLDAWADIPNGHIISSTQEISLNQPAPAAGTKAAVEAAMLRNAQLDARQITVDVSGSELTLHGTVGSWAEHRQAGYTAWAATGVTSVRNDLLVKS